MKTVISTTLDLTDYTNINVEDLWCNPEATSLYSNNDLNRSCSVERSYSIRLDKSLIKPNRIFIFEDECASVLFDTDATPWLFFEIDLDDDLDTLEANCIKAPIDIAGCIVFDEVSMDAYLNGY